MSASPIAGLRPGIHAALVGGTATGKSAIAMAIAMLDPRWEIVTVDSMQVYRGMDIGTAKPSPSDRASVPHHLIDVAEPSDDYDLRTYQRAASDVLVDIERRGQRALLVGGTALYLRAVVDDLTLPGRFPDVRAVLDDEPDTEGLHRRLHELDPVAAARMEPSNRRRVVRALEVTVGSGRPFSSFGPGLDQHPPTPFRLVALRWDRAALDARIHARFHAQMQAGFLDEVRRLVEDGPGLSRSAGQALGYRELLEHLGGTVTLDEAVELAIRRTRQFSRRQDKWFARVIRASPGSTARTTGRRSARFGRSWRQNERTMRMTKHHGLGNDFLVLLDLEGTAPIDEDMAIAVCDRHRGIGADGLIRVTRSGPGRFRMELRNEDGSRAEISGNGLCCLAQNVVRAGHASGGVVHVDTDAGPRTVEVVERVSGTSHRMRVAMGTPKIGDSLSEWEDGAILRVLQVDVGNPHVVCHVPDPDARIDLVALGERINDSTPGGTNVELVTAGERGELTMSVYERGVGLTEACGSGAVAAAVAGQHWALSPATVVVRQPGGPATVELGELAHLTVPVEAIAAAVWPL